MTTLAAQHDTSGDAGSVPERVEFQVSPEEYKHWRVSCDGPVATLVMDVDERGRATAPVGGNRGRARRRAGHALGAPG
jgi:hypothetical protein